MNPTNSELEEALANCDRDPVHIPGHIQNFGHLMAMDLSGTKITHLSDTLSNISDRSAQDLLGANPLELLSEQSLHRIRNILSHATISKQREIVGHQRIGDQSYQVSAHRSDDSAVIEFLQDPETNEDSIMVVEQARGFLEPSNSEEPITDLLARSAERLRFIVRFDRVKAYCFLPDGSGEVVAESRRPDVDSFLGLRFPASDIPPIARKLYAKTPIRFLQDIARTDVPVLALDPDAPPLDMSLAILRGLDVVHRQYLVNMDIASSMTVPIVVDGALWGLFACHHMQPKTPDPAALTAAELAGKLLSLRIQHTLEVQRETNLRRALQIANQLIVADDSELSAGQYWVSSREDLAKIVPCDGMIFAIGERIETYGDHPSTSACRALLAHPKPADDTIVALADLPLSQPDINWGDTAGAMILNLGGDPAMQLIFLRNQSETKVAWAGNPQHSVTRDKGGLKLTPRGSFDTYLQSAEGRCDDWRSHEVAAGQALQTAFQQAVTAQSSLRTNRHRMGLMVRELNHRVRNILSLVQSLSAHSRAGYTTVEGYALALESRIVALAGAHNLLTQSDMHGVGLGDLIDLELRPYRDSKKVDFHNGPEVFLRADAASVVALVLHELTTNAIKYGALSTADGLVHVAWSLENDGLTLIWRETNGPQVSEPAKEGFGRSIIDSAIPYEFSGTADLQFRPEGVCATFWMPKEVLVDAPPEASMTKGEVPSTERAPSPSGARERALVVEDNFVVAIQSKNMLKPEFFQEVDTVPSIEDALIALKTRAYNFCLLDVNIKDAYSTRVATELEKQGIPYFFATGYGSEGQEIVGDFSAPVLAKPIKIDMLRKMLHDRFGTT